MTETNNFKLGKPDSAERIKRTVINDNSDIIDKQLARSAIRLTATGTAVTLTDMCGPYYAVTNDTDTDITVTETSGAGFAYTVPAGQTVKMGYSSSDNYSEATTISLTATGNITATYFQTVKKYIDTKTSPAALEKEYKNLYTTMCKSSGASPLSFEGTGANLENYRVYGNSTQASTPSPSAPVAINSLGPVISVTCGGETKTITLDEPLRKSGSLADYINFAEGKLYRYVIHKTFDGTENWSATANKSCTYQIVAGSGGTINGGMCTHYANNSASQIGIRDGIYLSTTYVIMITDTSCADVASFKAKLANFAAAGNAVELITKYSSGALQSTTEISDLPSIPTVGGDNTITASTGNVQASKIEVYTTGNYYTQKEVNDLLSTMRQSIANIETALCELTEA